MVQYTTGKKFCKRGQNSFTVYLKCVILFAAKIWIAERRHHCMEYLSRSEAETEALGERLAAVLTPGAVVAYRGGLGMGKTAFTRGLARGLGCAGRVTSPTFTIVNEYSGTVPLFHFDMYRLGSSDELFDIGWEDYLIRGGVCAVEWSERVTDALPEDTLWVDIARGSGENDRIITITGGETR